MRTSIAMLAAALLATTTAVEASAQAIDIDGDVALTADVDGNQIVVGIGEDVTVSNHNASIIGQVKVRGDVRSTARVRGNQVVVGVGSNVCASNTNATMSSYAPCR
jgi:hypothetical protein